MRLDPASICLKIVPLSRVRLHEDSDPWRVKRLMVSLRHQRVLKNPIVVTEYEDAYVVLDGATRVAALTAMGLPHVLVQVVDYDDHHVRLQTWHHVLVGLAASGLVREFARIPQLRGLTADLPELQAALNARRALVGLVTPEGHVFEFLTPAGATEQIRQLGQVVGAYRGKAEIHRAAEVDLETLSSVHPDLTAVVVFPPFTSGDVRHCAYNEAKLPMGVTRHLIAGRALGVNVPLDLLGGDSTLEEKNAWLHDHTQNRLRRNMVRLYEEPTFIFDE